MKPQFVLSVLEEIRDEIRCSQVVVSVVAGVLLAQISAIIGQQMKICRVMPNTPCLIGQGKRGRNALPVGGCHKLGNLT